MKVKLHVYQRLFKSGPCNNMEIIDFEPSEPIDLRQIYSIRTDYDFPISRESFEIPQETEQDLKNYLRLGARFG